MRTPAELLLALADSAGPVPLTRLAKRLDARVSELLREFASLSDARLGGVAGPGWVSLHCDDAGRWTVTLTEAGRARLSSAQG